MTVNYKQYKQVPHSPDTQTTAKTILYVHKKVYLLDCFASNSNSFVTSSSCATRTSRAPHYITSVSVVQPPTAGYSLLIHIHTAAVLYLL